MAAVILHSRADFGVRGDKGGRGISITSALISMLLWSLLVLSGCQPAGEAPEEIQTQLATSAKPWTSLDIDDAPEDFSFAIVSDRTGQHRPGVFPMAMDKVNIMAPAFTVSVGDLIEGYTEDREQLAKEWDEMEGFIAKLDAPFFYTAGNHDMNNELMANEWLQRFGPSYYHFVYKDVLFLVLNSELFGMVGRPDTPVPGPWQQAEQMEFVRAVLAEHEQARHTIVLIHQPLWDPGRGRDIDPDWLEVESLLGSRAYTVFAGHYHQYTATQRHDRRYITLATTGGGSSLRGAQWGEFDQIAWVQMREDGPKIANLTLAGILPDDVSSHSSRGVLEALHQAVQINFPLDDSDTFRESLATITISNPLPADLQISARVRQRGGFEIGGIPPLTLAKGESRELAVPLSVTKATLYRDLRTAVLDWTLTGEDAAGSMVQTTTSKPLRPLTEHRISAVGKPVTIDGQLDDWPELPYVADRQGDAASSQFDAQDVSFRFGLGHDDEFLHIAVSVTDDAVVSDSRLLARMQDAVVIDVDTREDAQRNRNMPVVPAILEGFYQGMVVQILSVVEPAEDTFLPVLKKYAAEVTSAVQQTDTGYNVELAIPHSVLDRIANGTWDKARIGVRVYDLDDAGHNTPEILHWQPDRFGSAPMDGSHAFVRTQ